jgi:hypothetical protein
MGVTPGQSAGSPSGLSIGSPEHTWGTDVKTTLHDETNWLNADFHKVQFTASNFLATTGARQAACVAIACRHEWDALNPFTASWIEQRNWGLAYPLEALGTHPLAADIRYCAALAAVRPAL